MLARLFLIQSSSKFQVTWTGVKLGRVRFWAESDHSFWSYLLLSDENFTLLNLNISEASWPFLIKMCSSIIGVGERLHKVLGHIGLKLVSMATESPHWLIRGKWSLQEYLPTINAALRGWFIFYLSMTQRGCRVPTDSGVTVAGCKILILFIAPRSPRGQGGWWKNPWTVLYFICILHMSVSVLCCQSVILK